MDWSFRLLMVFAAAFALVAGDHYLLGGWLQASLAGSVKAALATLLPAGL
ncbi:MAG: hypothetical protein ACFBRM_09925 [Pikeienuella sp.]